MKKNVMLVGLMLMSTIIFAQRHGAGRGERETKRAEKMKTELSLNDDQYARVKAIDEKFSASFVKLRKDTALTIGTMHKRMEKMKADQDTQLKGVLTDAQWTKWTALKAKRVEERKNHKRGKPEKG